MPWSRGLIALFTAIALALPAMAEPLELSAFRDRVAAEWHARIGDTIVAVGDGGFDTRSADGTTGRINVDNVYARYLENPEAAESIIDSFIFTLVQSHTNRREKIEQLVIIIRPADYVSKALAQKPDMTEILPSKPLAGDVAMFLAVDSEQSLRTAGPDDLSRWKIDLQTAWEVARTNIKARMGQVEMFRVGNKDGASGLGAASGLAPSLLANGTFCGPETEKDKGRMVVLVVSKDVFLYADTEDRLQTARFWKAAAQLAKDGASLSLTPLSCEQGKWVAVPFPDAPRP